MMNSGYSDPEKPTSSMTVIKEEIEEPEKPTSSMTVIKEEIEEPEKPTSSMTVIKEEIEEPESSDYVDYDSEDGIMADLKYEPLYNSDDSTQPGSSSPESLRGGMKKLDMSYESPSKKPADTWRSNIWKGVGEAHFTCEYCSERFQDKMAFTEHLFLHRQQEQEKLDTTCVDCHVFFHNEAVLNDHYKRSGHGRGRIIKSETGELAFKLFACKLCNSKFKEEKYYRVHVKSHRQPPIHCPKCHLTFQYDFYLKEHLQKHHKRKRSARNRKSRKTVLSFKK